ncbi:MAG: sugar ABC transporter permease, partial [Anaerolineae bacterium]|nr:sugar ABC transporter permease [Anaerolineae bacterium]
GQLARYVAKAFRLSESEQRKIFWGFLFASPWIIGFIIFVVGPALASLYYSFTDYKLGETPVWNGLENYRELVMAEGRDGRNFRSAMYNSLFYAIVGVPLQVGAALGMAVILNAAVRGVRVFRLIFYMPVILAGGPAILLAWRYMLAANGGFVNNTLSSLSDNFFLFNWLYRGFIFAVEGFNGFFIGLTKGDPTGPFTFFLPALIGFLVLFSLVRGEWDANKRARAQTTIEIIGFIVGGLLVAVGLMAEPIDPSWTYIWAVMVIVGWWMNIHRGQIARAKVWQYAGVGLLLLGFILTLVTQPQDGLPDDKSAYLIPIIISVIPILLTFGKNIDRRILGASIAIFIGIVLVRVAPHQLLDGKADVIVRYLTLQTAIIQPDNLDYLNEGYIGNYMDASGLFIALIGILMATLMLKDNRIRRYVLIGSCVMFGVMTVSSGIDGVRYFGAHETLAQAEGKANFHFARYRDATDEFPNNDQDPKWLTSDLWVKPSLILINMWSAGAGMLIFLAALKGVPKSLYEAAEVDGANRVQRFFKITLPMISPAMFYNVVIGMIGALQTFEAVYILRNNDTQTSVMSAAFYLYQRTFEQANIGEGSAMSWILAVIIVGLTVMQFRYSNWVHYEV